MPRRQTESRMLSRLVDQIIDRARTDRGWTQAELAFRSDLRPETLSLIKAGCQFDSLERLARTAGMRIIAIPDDDHVSQVLTGGDFRFEDFDD
jgi:ribosome-binding protein aMBF1 (putative translation factor)